LPLAKPNVLWTFGGSTREAAGYHFVYSRSENSLPSAMILNRGDSKGNPNVALRHSRFFVSIHLCKQACNVPKNKKSNAVGIGFPLSG
jgi:hypothetical protein